MLHSPTNLADLGLLSDVAALLSSCHDLNEALGPVLRMLSERSHLKRATLALWDPDHQIISIEAAHGLTPDEVRRTRFKPGQGITGRVIQRGVPQAVARISRASGFVDWTGLLPSGKDPSFSCVPVLGTQGVLGALGAYHLDASETDLPRDLHLLAVVAGLLTPLVAQRLRRSKPHGEEGDSTASQTDPLPDRMVRPANLIGRSKAMNAVYELLLQVIDTKTTVLLRGESGTGKELIALALHREGSRAREAFVKVNCAALPEGLVESELFGHEKGAFTGAIQRRIGRFELARGGTLFLDEIGDLPPAIQVKLLRVLQEREFERVGGSKTLTTDVRLVTATSHDLEAMVSDGRFRADLYYRLNVFPIRLPALRERKADILLLADHFVSLCNQSHGRTVKRIATSAIDMLMAYHWPGNVRELENCIERAVLLAREDVILGHHLPPTLQTAEASATSSSEGLKNRLDLLERELILDALKSTSGNMASAARQLQVSERIMGLRVTKHAIDASRFKARAPFPTKM